MEIAALPIDAPATLIWSSDESFGREVPELRREFDRLDGALEYLQQELPVGHRHTAWLISSNRLIPPEDVERLRGKLATAG